MLRRVLQLRCNSGKGARSYRVHRARDAAQKTQNRSAEESPEMKKALITGCTGQDGSYLTELLLSLGYEVHGLKRRSSSLNTERIDHIYEDSHNVGAHFFLHYADLTDGSSLASILHEVKPDEIYNLGAQSHVKVSFEVPEFTSDTVAIGTLRLLDAIRRGGAKCRFYQ